MKPPKETTDSEHQAAWWSSPGVLYFFAVGDPIIAIKIGVAACTRDCSLAQAVRRRFSAIQSSNHETVELLGVVQFKDGQFPTRQAEVVERELHIRFAPLQRFKAHSRGAEWFSSSAELLDYIRANSNRPADLGLPSVIAMPINRQNSQGVAMACDPQPLSSFRSPAIQWPGACI
jgi:hypothetical protein